MKRIMIVGSVDTELAEALRRAFANSKAMTDEEVFEQRISFAYGNVSMHDSSITKEMVREQAEKLYGKRPLK